MNENPDESIVFDLYFEEYDTRIVCMATVLYTYRPYRITNNRKLPFGLMLA